jgi:hypothetical protein
MACASLEGGALSSMIMGARVPGYPEQYLVINNIIKYLGATSGILFLLLLTRYLVINIIKYLGPTC